MEQSSAFFSHWSLSMRKEQSAKRRGGQKDCNRSGKRRSGIEGGQRTSKQVKRSGEKQPAESPNGLPSRAWKPIKRRRRRRIRLGEAFRKVGLDEQTVAENYVGVVETLREKTGPKTETAQKLLVDVLKECSRILEPPRGVGTGSIETPTIVELHHEVSRPVRDLPETDADEI